MEKNNSGVELTGFAPISTDIKYDNDKNSADSSEIDDVGPTPGSVIAPQATKTDAIRLAQRLYCISTRDISQLFSYDDRNFKIHIDTNIKNPIIPKAWPHGYVLKIINSHDTKNVKFADGQIQLMLFLRQQGIECSKPVMNIFGEYYSIEKIGESSNMVRLYEFLPGKILMEVPKTHHLFYQVGEFIARIDSALKHFQHDGYKNKKSIWMLESVPHLPKFLYAVGDEKKQQLVEQVLNAFNEQIVKHKDQFAKGIIHGDFNEQNIIVNKTSPESDEYRVTGIIDFMDTCHTLYVFELATAIAYMILQTCELETAGYLIAGYQELRLIPENERHVLKTCAAARLCQSLVLGCYTHSLHPDNDNLLYTQGNGWTMLEKMWLAPNNEVEELWFSTADNYVKQSTK